MGIETVAAVITAATAVGGTVASIQQGRQASKQSRKAQAAQDAANAARAQKERQDIIRKARIQGAAILSNLEASGASGGSATTGATGTQAQLAGNLGFLDQLSLYAQTSTTALSKAQGFKQNQDTFSGAANLAAGVFQALPASSTPSASPTRTEPPLPFNAIF